jgi:hypothetical protein
MLLGGLSLWGHLYTGNDRAYWDSRMEVFYPHLWEQHGGSVFSKKQWEKFDYGNSPFIQNPRWSEPITSPENTE